MDKPKQLKQNSRNQKKSQKVVEKTINGKKTTITLQPSSIQEAFRRGGAKRKTYAKGGPTEPEKTQPKEETTKSESPATPTATSSVSRSSQLGSMTGKQYRQEKRGVKREAKLDRIKSGKQGDRVDNVVKAVGATAEAVANVTDAVNSVRSGLKKNGGAAKKIYKTGGMVNSNKKVSAAKTATKYLGGKSAEPKGASKVAKGRVGGTSKAPKTAKPRR